MFLLSEALRKKTYLTAILFIANSIFLHLAAEAATAVDIHFSFRMYIYLIVSTYLLYISQFWDKIHPNTTLSSSRTVLSPSNRWFQSPKLRHFTQLSLSPSSYFLKIIRKQLEKWIWVDDMGIILIRHNFTTNHFLRWRNGGIPRSHGHE